MGEIASTAAVFFLLGLVGVVVILPFSPLVAVLLQLYYHFGGLALRHGNNRLAILLSAAFGIITAFLIGGLFSYAVTAVALRVFSEWNVRPWLIVIFCFISSCSVVFHTLKGILPEVRKSLLDDILGVGLTFYLPTGIGAAVLCAAYWVWQLSSASTR